MANQEIVLPKFVKISHPALMREGWLEITDTTASGIIDEDLEVVGEKAKGGFGFGMGGNTRGAVVNDQEWFLR